MEIHKYIFLMIISIKIFANDTLPKKISDKIYLNIGDAKELTLDATCEVSLSKKGVVDFFYLENNTWKVVALKKGFITVHSKNCENTSAQTYLIYVEKPAENKIKLKIPQVFCEEQNVICNENNGSVSGTFNNLKHFYGAKKSCEKQKNCFFDGILSDEEKSKLIEKLYRIIPENYDLEITDSGEIIIDLPCQGNPKELEDAHKIFQNLSIYKENSSFTCQKKSITQYELKSKVILVKESSSNSLGLDTKDAILSLGQMSFQDYLQNNIKALTRDHKVSVIGEPSLSLKEGIYATAHTGGEYAVEVLALNESTKASKRVIWKTFGLMLKVKVEQTQDANLLLDYDLELKNPVHGDESKFTSNKLQSHVVIPQDKAVIVGSIEYQKTSTEKNGIPFISKMPIIGPLLNLVLDDDSRVKIFLWMEVHKS